MWHVFICGVYSGARSVRQKIWTQRNIISLFGCVESLDCKIWCISSNCKGGVEKTLNSTFIKF